MKFEPLKSGHLGMKMAHFQFLIYNLRALSETDRYETRANEEPSRLSAASRVNQLSAFQEKEGFSGHLLLAL